jgi:hypothetical protein
MASPKEPLASFDTASPPVLKAVWSRFVANKIKQNSFT